MMVPAWAKITTAAAVIAATLTTGAMAFPDVNGIPEGKAIMELKARGVVNGINPEKFAPKGQMTAQQAVALLVKGLDLSIDHIRFPKQPQASDYYTNVPNDAWYAEAFIIAQLNGIPLPKDIDPKAPVTREQFVHYLMTGVYTKGDYEFIELFMDFKDADNVTQAYMDTIQKALITNIASLNGESKFRPGDIITRAEAAVLVRNAIHFVEKQNAPDPKPVTNPDEADTSEAVTYTTSAMAGNVQQVTLSWGEKPNPGYRMTVSAIVFPSEASAVIHYKLHYPEPGQMYAQVITEPKAVAFLPAGITDIKLVQAQ